MVGIGSMLPSERRAAMFFSKASVTLKAGLYFTVVLSTYYQIAVLVRAGQIIGERTDSLTELVFITSGHCTLYSVCLSALQELS